jgi:hypothetical protein
MKTSSSTIPQRTYLPFVLREIDVVQLGVSPDAVIPSAKFIEDLGMGLAPSATRCTRRSPEFALSPFW